MTRIAWPESNFFLPPCPVFATTTRAPTCAVGSNAVIEALGRQLSGPTEVSVYSTPNSIARNSAQAWHTDGTDPAPERVTPELVDCWNVSPPDSLSGLSGTIGNGGRVS
jgi:hypothetical protein